MSSSSSSIDELIRKKKESVRAKLDSEKKEAFINVGLPPPAETEEELILEIRKLREQLGAPSNTMLGELRKMRNDLKHAMELKEAAKISKSLP